MKRKKGLIFCFFVLLSLVFAILVLKNVSAVGEPSLCCERTIEGAWCQNSPPNDCAGAPYRKASTSCESTSYCKLGTCVDSKQGTCLENTPQRVCQASTGVWVAGKPEDIPQCKLGCCLLGDQAEFVTQTSCKALSADFGLETDFRADIKTEAECITSANPKVEGACVIDNGLSGRSCRRLAKEDCTKLDTGANDTTIEFHEGLLCSAEILGTNCGPTKKTTCVPDKFGVYFVDTCGNIANIYDALKVNSQDYWTRIMDVSESCNPDLSNAKSATCGNCDYGSGSICRSFERGNMATTQPQYGDFVCADLGCNYKGQTYKHGETWCTNSTAHGVSTNSPGSVEARLLCYNGEVTNEPMDPFRGTLCSESTSNEGYRVAGPVVNLWQTCTVQDNKKDCEDAEKRDCNWVEGESILDQVAGTTLVVDADGKLVPKEDDEDDKRVGASCVPKYAPGFDFWNPDGSATVACAQASSTCVAKFEKGLVLDGWDCVENCQCFTGNDPDTAKVSKTWLEQKNKMCIALGDCGEKKNYLGVSGYHNNDSVVVTKDCGDNCSKST